MPLFLPATVECRRCGQVFEAVWEDESDTLDDLAEAPAEDQVCPSCGNVHPQLEWPGWTFRSEAG